MIPILYKRIGTANKNFEATAKKKSFFRQINELI